MVSIWGSRREERTEKGSEEFWRVFNTNSSGFEGGHYLPACGTCHGSCETAVVLNTSRNEFNCSASNSPSNSTRTSAASTALLMRPPPPSL
ncbi:hypothetical protein MHYP_G00160010 [Metynnis hypsauchen]